MTTEVKMMRSPCEHSFDIEYVCYQQGCPSNAFCSLCLQTHLQICPGVFGQAIRKLDQPQPPRRSVISNDESVTPMDDTFEAISENTDNARNSPATTTAEEFIAQKDAMKLRVVQPINDTFELEKQICQGNRTNLEELKRNLVSLVENMCQTWADEQEGKLRGMNKSSQQQFSRLKEIEIQVKGMHFDSAHLMKNLANIHELETKIAPEAALLVESIRQVMDGWVFNKDRIADYQEAVSRFIQGVEFTNLLSNDQLEFKASSLPQAPDDEVQRIRKEVETLRIGDLYLKDEIHRLRQEVDSLKKEKDSIQTALADLTKTKDEVLAKQKLESSETLKKELAALAKAKDDLLAKEAENNKAALVALTKAKDDALANISKQKADADAALVKEREASKTALVTLTKTKEETIANLTKQKADADAVLVKEREDSKVALAASIKAKDDALASAAKQKADADATLVKEREANKVALATLTKTKDETIANLTKQKAEADAVLAKEREVNKAALATLTKTKDDALANVTKQKTDADAALVKEREASKVALAASTKAKDEAIAKLTKEVNDLKAKLPK